MTGKDRTPDRKRPAVHLVDATLSPAGSALKATMRHERPGERVALVLSGGIGLGAYQAGAHARLDEAGGWRPDRIASSSTGAVNAAFIAGGPPGTSVGRLRRFWEAVPRPEPLALLPFMNEGPWRQASNWMSVMQARMPGSSRCFRSLLRFERAASPVPSLCDLTPKRELVDVDRLHDDPVRIGVVTPDILTGEELVFDAGRGDRMGVEHLPTSSGLLPDFALVGIAGRLLGVRCPPRVHVRPMAGGRAQHGGRAADPVGDPGRPRRTGTGRRHPQDRMLMRDRIEPGPGVLPDPARRPAVTSPRGAGPW